MANESRYDDIVFIAISGIDGSIVRNRVLSLEERHTANFIVVGLPDMLTVTKDRYTVTNYAISSDEANHRAALYVLYADAADEPSRQREIGRILSRRLR